MCREATDLELATRTPGIALTQMWVCDLVMGRSDYYLEVNSVYQALYRKYRPQTFDDMVGQQAVTQTLKTQLNSGKLSHAYLFTGSRGTGKTSAAKILSKAVNCENPIDGNPCCRCASCMAIDSGSCMDVLEIDAASNNGVDNVRDLRDDAIYTPSQVKKRVYIIDEVHMLSMSAFNALLKIIEEPPEHLLFILATTELHKVPATILSRCQRFAFRRIGQEDIASRLQYVAYQEGIDLDASAAMVLARLADGGLRDGLSLLDQCASATAGELTVDRVYSCLGIAGVQDCAQLMSAIGNKDAKTALSLVNRSYAEGKDLRALLDELACVLRDLMVLKTAPRESISLLSGVATETDIMPIASQLSTGELVYMMNCVQETLHSFTSTGTRRMDAELCILNLCQPELLLNAESINARLCRVEDQLKSGNIVAKTPLMVQPIEEELPPPPDDFDAPPITENVLQTSAQELPVGFWTDLTADLRNSLPIAVRGFFHISQNPQVNGVIKGDVLELRCDSAFTMQQLDKPDILNVISLKASARLGKQMRVSLVDVTARPSDNRNMSQLLNFGREHSDIVRIKDKNQ